MITGRLIIEQVLNGLMLGCMYAIVASGLTIIWGTMRLINFGHGEFYMLGAYVLYLCITLLALSPIYSLLIAIVIVFALAIVIEKVAINPLLDKPNWDNNALVVTVGISVFFQNFALRVFGERFKSVPYFLDGTLEVFGLRMAYQRILIFAISTGLLLGVWWFIKKAKFGLALRATAQDMDEATIVGINTKSIYVYTFSISCAMAALAGGILAPIFMINPWMGFVPLIKGFVTVVLGGLGSFEGAILAGFMLGIVESITVILTSSEWKDVAAFLILIVTLGIKPSGLFGTKEW